MKRKTGFKDGDPRAVQAGRRGGLSSAASKKRVRKARGKGMGHARS